MINYHKIHFDNLPDPAAAAILVLKQQERAVAQVPVANREWVVARRDTATPGSDAKSHHKIKINYFR